MYRLNILMMWQSYYSTFMSNFFYAVDGSTHSIHTWLIRAILAVTVVIVHSVKGDSAGSVQAGERFALFIKLPLFHGQNSGNKSASWQRLLYSCICLCGIDAYLIKGHREGAGPPRPRLRHRAAAAGSDTDGTSWWCSSATGPDLAGLASPEAMINQRRLI